MSDLVFIPVSVAELECLVAGGELSGERAGFAPTQQLREYLEYSPDMLEELERATLILASVLGLSQFGVRVVVVANQLAYSDWPDEAHNGGVRVAGIPAESVTCWFGDENSEAAEQAAADCNGMSLDEAWEVPSVKELVETSNLLWYGPKELINS